MRMDLPNYPSGGVTEGVLAGWHNYFNHKIQLVIKDAMKVTPRMVNSIGTLQKQGQQTKVACAW